MRNMIRLLGIGLALALSAGAAWAEVRLVMAEQVGCAYCERWDHEIAEIYPKTGEGQAAPLLRYDIHSGTPASFELARPVNFTPTFILVVDGQEVNRIEGYPGEDFFWGLLGMMLERADVPVVPAQPSGAEANG